jgi:spore maturation protein CgeB
LNRKLLEHYLRKGFHRALGRWKPGLEHEAFLGEAVDVLYPKVPYRTEVVGSPPSKPLRVLYAALKYDYDNPRQGLSLEENCFFHTLLHMGHELVRFDFGTLTRRFGRQAMNQMLREATYRYDPDLLFTVLFKEEFDKSVIREITEETRTVTCNWFCDDQWRFDSYSRYWASVFDWVVTTHKSVLPKYSALGYSHVILSQWACNPLLHRRLDLPCRYDVSFIGQPFGQRREIITRLRKAGIAVATWGYGWPSGRVSLCDMVRIFNQSKINLDFAEFSRGGKGIKARPFEISGSGGFVLTEFVEDLSEYYAPGQEVECFSSFSELLDKIRFYLGHEKNRESIAQRGYERTIREHTYAKRLQQVFESIFTDPKRGFRSDVADRPPGRSGVSGHAP